jgi:F-type H+-transporting ATPase subunit delta
MSTATCFLAYALLSICMTMTWKRFAQVDLVLLPALTGDFGVMPGHVPTVAQLRPGVVTVHKTLDKDIDKYFVSSGFAFVHADSSTDVCAVEAVKVDDLDPEAVRAGLQVRCCCPGSCP